jgi:hypothetical protein
VNRHTFEVGRYRERVHVNLISHSGESTASPALAYDKELYRRGKIVLETFLIGPASYNVSILAQFVISEGTVRT